jgi:hypothetical protein
MIDKARRASLSSARRVVRRILLAPFAIVAVAILAFCVIKTWRLLDWRNVGQAGIAEVVAVPIRGAVQYVFIRGYDRRKPLLLFLPGGPGESYVPREAEFSRGLEHDFVMAQVEFGVGKAEIRHRRLRRSQRLARWWIGDVGMSSRQPRYGLGRRRAAIRAPWRSSIHFLTR